MLLEFAQDVLGQDLVIDSIAVVTALAGAEEQHLHRDHPDLFSDQPAARALLGAYAITIAIPLVDLTPTSGTTRLFVGSHRRERRTNDIVLPYVERGCCYAMDYRLWHQGAENRSAQERPIVYLVYSRPWFIDVNNYADVRRINIDADDLAAIAPEHRPLFRGLAAPGAFDRPQKHLFPSGSRPQRQKAQ